jgi:chromosome segregation ATPase
MKRASDKPGDGRQPIEVLQQRFQSLNTRKIQAETNLDNARKELERLQRESRDKYGTDDVDELRKKLEQMKSDNEEKRRNYQADLDRIESELSEIESRYERAGTPGEPS